MDTYLAAEAAPEDITATQGIASLTVRTGAENTRLEASLTTIALRGEDKRGRVSD